MYPPCYYLAPGFTGGQEERIIIMDHKNLEDELHKAIQRCCSTDEDKEEALKYFHGCTVCEIINEALEE